MTKTYIENEVVPHIPEEYSEDNLRKKFEKRESELWAEIENNMEFYNQLKNTEKNAENSGETSVYWSDSELNKQLQIVRTQTKDCRAETENVQYEKKLLQKYGQAFANLYYIKDEHEKKGYSEKLSFTEVDITGNGDMITDNQHYGMSYNPQGRLMQPALAVKIDELEFNVGMMEFNKPNSIPEVKLQISFDEQTADNLDADKLNAIFDFCEKHGISASDMVVRRFDGSIDDSAVQEKIKQLAAEVEAKRAEQEAKAAREEYEQQKSREKELIKEIENVVTENGGKLPKGLSLEETINTANKLLPADKQIDAETISADVPLPNELIKVKIQGNGKQATPDNKMPLPNKTVALQSSQLSDENGEEQSGQDQAQNQSQATSSPNSIAIPQNKAATANNAKVLKKEKVEQKFETFFEEGLAKRRGLSYFKTHTSLLGLGWTEYIIYDTEDKKNRSKDGVEDKNGNVKYTYAFKFFIKQEKDGSMSFAYRTPYHKPLNEDMVGGIVGQLKDLGFTHVNFPVGLTDKEKGIWRKALAEKGMVPIGISLDRSKAEGMIKVAKEKLSSEDYSKFKYRLALQMDKRNKQKGKKVDPSEQEFIDTLLLAHKYEAFSTGYAEVLKSKITRLVHPLKEKENGAVNKIAAMSNLRRLFNVFREGVDSGSILNSEALTDKEKNLIKQNHPELHENPSKFTGAHLSLLYDIMFKESHDIAHDELEKKFREPGAKRADEAIKQGEFNAAYNSCKSIIKELKSLGVDEIDLPETTTKLPYNAPIRNNNKTAQTKTTQNTNTNVVAAHSFERSDR